MGCALAECACKQAQAGRIFARKQQIPQTSFSFVRTQGHGLMATTAGRNYLVCFYCNKRSGIKNDGLITQWECAKCDSMNYLDENGEITDPPVATEYAAPSSIKFAFPRADSLSPQSSESGPFCSTCLKNQHLYAASLAQVHIETDPGHPDYRKAESQYYKFKKDLEKRYPQVCEDCEPKALERLRRNRYTAQSEFLGTALNKTRVRMSAYKPKAISLSEPIIVFGKLLWHIGLFGQFSWNIMGLAGAPKISLPAAFIHSIPPSILPSVQYLFGLLISLPTSKIWAWRFLMCSLVSLWWNPMYKEMHRGFMNHIKGIGDWYKLQSISILARGIFYFGMGSGVLADPSSSVTRAAHGFIFMFSILVFTKSRRALRADLTSLWTTTPERFPYVGPGSRKPEVSQNSGSPEAVLNGMADPTGMADALDQIAATPSRVSKVSANSYSRTPSPPHLPMAGGRLADPKAGTSSLSAMTTDEVARYLKTGEIPTRLSPQEASISSEEMDWDLQYPVSQHRAFRPVGPVQSNTRLFGQSPVANNSTFWYKVPPAPVTPAHRLRNPPNQPRLRVASKEVKENFFNNVTQQGSNENGGPSGEDRLQNKVEFAQPKFFPPPSDNGTPLIDLLKSFSLTDTDAPPETVIGKSSRIRHACQGLALLLALFFWYQAFNRPFEYSKTVALAVMVGCAFIGARNIVDNTVFAVPDKDLALVYTLGACIGGLELSGAGYGFLKVLAETGDPENCASLGTLLVGGMLVCEIWFASFGRGVTRQLHI